MDKVIEKYELLDGIKAVIQACDNPSAEYDEDLQRVVFVEKPSWHWDKVILRGFPRTPIKPVEDLRLLNQIILMWRSKDDEDPSNPI